MTTERTQRFVNAQIALMLGTILCLAVIDTLTLELFAVVSIIGFVLLVVATAPVNVTPRWRSRLKWPVLLGILLFVYLVIREVLSVTQTLF